MPSITFEVSQANDAEALVALRIEAMRESLERIGRFDPVRARERFLNGFAPERTHHILLRGERVGFYVLTAQEDGLMLNHLYIRPGHQGQGVGAFVLAHIFKQADATGQDVRLGALRGSASNRFYLAHGFVKVDEAEFDLYYLRRPRQ
ncbi:MAG: GNAT family N-acetyltransferase [Burkholderiales bacterium]|nr:GNAT family N-acetyltransferase [Burkholderiales bacterium]